MVLEKGDRVEVASKGLGTVRFVGETQFAPGITWVGVELDQANGKNNGSVQGVKYFVCDENFGCFVKEDAIRQVSASTSTVSPPRSVSSNASVTSRTSSRSSSRLAAPRTSTTPSVSTKPTSSPASSQASHSPNSIKDETGKKETPARVKVTDAASKPSPQQGTLAKLRERKQALQQRIKSSVSKTSGISPPTSPAASSTSTPSAPSRSLQESTSSTSSTSVSTDQAATALEQSDGESIKVSATLASLTPTQNAQESEELQQLKLQLESSTNRIKELENSVETEATRARELEAKRENEVGHLRSEMEAEKEKRSELEGELRRLKNQLERVGLDAEAKDKAALLKLQRTIDKQAAELEELNSMVESLSLDKETLEEEKDIAEEKVLELELQVEQMKVEFEEEKLALAERTPVVQIAGGEEGVDASLTAKLKETVEENEKLRDALKRLHTASTSEKTELARQVKQLQKERDTLAQTAAQVESLRTAKKSLEEQVEELKSMLDTAQAYESMVEELSERNLELADENADLKEANEELEELRQLSEEMEQQNIDYQKELQAEMSAKESELVSVQLALENLKKDLASQHAMGEKLRERLLESQAESEDLHARLKELEKLQDILTETKDQARSANLALLSEGEAKVASAIQVHQSRSAKRQNEYRAVCLEALVPDSVMDKKSKEVLTALLASLQVQDTASLVADVLVQAGVSRNHRWEHRLPLTCQQIITCCLTVAGDMCRMWQLVTQETSFTQLQDWTSSFAPAVSQAKHALLEIVQSMEKDPSLTSLSSNQDSLIALVQVLLSACATFNGAFTKACAGMERESLGSLLLPLRQLQLGLVNKLDTTSSNMESDEQGEQVDPAWEPVLKELSMLCQLVQGLESGSVVGVKISEDTQAKLQATISSLEQPGELGSLNPDAVSGLVSSVRAQVTSLEPTEKETPLTAGWRERSEAVVAMLDGATETKKELENVKGALKRRVLEAHNKSNELNALQLVKEDLEQKLDAAREVAKEQLDLAAKCKNLESQLDAKDLEYQKAIEVAKEASQEHEAHIAALERRLEELATLSTAGAPEMTSTTKSKSFTNPLAAAKAAASGATTTSTASSSSSLSASAAPVDVTSSSGEYPRWLVNYLRGEVSFWKARAIRSKLESLAPLTFTPRLRFGGKKVGVPSLSRGEERLDVDTSQEKLREMLLLQSKMLIPTKSKSPEVSFSEQLLGQRLKARQLLRSVELSREEKSALQRVGFLQVSGVHLDNNNNNNNDAPVPLVLSRRGFDSLFKPLPLLA